MRDRVLMELNSFAKRRDSMGSSPSRTLLGLPTSNRTLLVGSPSASDFPWWIVNDGNWPIRGLELCVRQLCGQDLKHYFETLLENIWAPTGATLPDEQLLPEMIASLIRMLVRVPGRRLRIEQ